MNCIAVHEFVNTAPTLFLGLISWPSSITSQIP